MDGVNTSDEEYPQELLDAHYMDGVRVHYPFEDVLHGLEVLLVEKGAFQEMSPGETPDPDRWRTLSDYIEHRSQEELSREMREHDDPVVSSAAKHIDPEWEPRTENTFKSLRLATSFGYCEVEEPEQVQRRISRWMD